MEERPPYLKSGEPARLFPVLGNSNAEQRITSIFLAVLTQVRPFAEELFNSIRKAGPNVGKRTRISSYIEVVFEGENEKGRSGDRPDGLIVLRNGKKEWRALVEAKVGKNHIGGEQIERYLKICRCRNNNIDAIITISNQFTSSPYNPPYICEIDKRKIGNTNICHWSWAFVSTVAEVVYYSDSVEDAEQSYILKEFIRFVSHAKMGVERFSQMPPEWKEVVQRISKGISLKPNDEIVRNALAGWIAEERDLSLHLSSHVGCHVQIVGVKFSGDLAHRIEEMAKAFCKHHKLHMKLRVPGAASDIEVCADVEKKMIKAAMQVNAPDDERYRGPLSRIRWLADQLAKSNSEYLDELLITARWKGGKTTVTTFGELKGDRSKLVNGISGRELVKFNVELHKDLGSRRFEGVATFIKELEKLVIDDFYDGVVQHIKKWVPAAPRPIKKDSEKCSNKSVEQIEGAGSAVHPSSDDGA